jgi:hypothetical protein
LCSIRATGEAGGGQVTAAIQTRAHPREVVPTIGSTDAIAVEVEDVGVGTEIDRRYGACRVVDHANERVVFTVVWLLGLVLHDARGAIGVENDEKLASGVDADARAFVERRGQCRWSGGCGT